MKNPGLSYIFGPWTRENTVQQTVPYSCMTPMGGLMPRCPWKG